MKTISYLIKEIVIGKNWSVFNGNEVNYGSNYRHAKESLSLLRKNCSNKFKLIKNTHITKNIREDVTPKIV